MGKLQASKKPSGQQEARKRTARGQEDCQEEASKRTATGQEAARCQFLFRAMARMMHEFCQALFPSYNAAPLVCKFVHLTAWVFRGCGCQSLSLAKVVQTLYEQAHNSKKPGRGQQEASKTQAARGQQKGQQGPARYQEASKRPGRGFKWE